MITWCGTAFIHPQITCLGNRPTDLHVGGGGDRRLLAAVACLHVLGEAAAVVVDRVDIDCAIGDGVPCVAGRSVAGES